MNNSTLNTNEDDSAQTREFIDATKAWLEKAVIGLNLCPFAKAVHVKKQIRYVVSAAHTPEELQADLAAELKLLDGADPEQIDTTLLIHPGVLTDFMDYNDFLEIADATVEQLGLEGHIQVASFHPDYQFADTSPDDIDNYTNRSPYPTLHLLREESVERAIEAFPDAAEIFEKNVETMRRLGRDGWESLGISVADKQNKTDIYCKTKN
ncbi:MAG: uncharacterized protein V7606_1777 [Burkholderiales bacterium]